MQENPSDEFEENSYDLNADWVLQCRVLNFIELDPPHSGVVIAQAVMECLVE